MEPPSSEAVNFKTDTFQKLFNWICLPVGRSSFIHRRTDSTERYLQLEFWANPPGDSVEFDGQL